MPAPKVTELPMQATFKGLVCAVACAQHAHNNKESKQRIIMAHKIIFKTAACPYLCVLFFT